MPQMVQRGGDVPCDSILDDLPIMQRTRQAKRARERRERQDGVRMVDVPRRETYERGGHCWLA